MVSNSNKTPPLLSKAKTCNDWIKLLDIWTEFTELPKKRQGPAVLFSLEDKAQQGVLETLSKEEILTETDVAKIRSELDKIYKKDETTEKYFTPTSKAKKKGTQITEDLLDSNHHNKDTTNNLLETGIVISSKQIHRIYKDNINGETLLEVEL